MHPFQLGSLETESCGSDREGGVVCWVALAVLSPGAALPLILLVVPPRADIIIQHSGPA